MSREQFDNDCPGCRPCLINAKTGEVFPDDSPEMKAVNEMWEETTLEERRAFHRFSCLNSRDPKDMEVIESLSRRMKDAMPRSENNW